MIEKNLEHTYDAALETLAWGILSKLLHIFIEAQLMVASSNAASNKMIPSAKENQGGWLWHVILKVLKEPTKDSAHWNGRLILQAAVYGACDGAQR